MDVTRLSADVVYDRSSSIQENHTSGQLPGFQQKGGLRVWH